MNNPGPAFPNSMRVFRSGVEYSSWPGMKFAQDQAHRSFLQSTIGLWAASDPVTVDFHIADDRMTVDYVLNVRQPPPILEWSARFGDILHNLHSSLDTLAWELCHLDGQEPSSPKSVYFPACQSEKEWAKVAKVLVSMPPDALTYINATQPYHTANPELTYLGLLRDLSNLDKHRALVTCHVEPRKINSTDSILQMVEDAPDDVPPFTMSAVSTTGPLRHGMVIARLRAARPIESVTGVNKLEVETQVTFGDTAWPVIDLADRLIASVFGVFRVLGGDYTEKTVARDAMSFGGQRVGTLD